jgi:creatinine amidohydrolase
MNQNECRFEYLYDDELFQRIQERPLAWVPLGILERHGGHLPWGLDGLKAHKACLWLAERLGGIVLPASHLAGIHGDSHVVDEPERRKHAAEDGLFLYREQTFHTFLYETFESLANLGFQVIVGYTGHYPTIQMQVLQAAAETLNATGRAVVIPFWEPLACGEGDHGGKWETSIYMALAPEEVRFDAIREERTGRPGFYRGQDVRSNASVAFGEKALAQVEAYLTAAITQAFAIQSREHRR